MEKNAKISEIVYLAINEGFSRLPVYEKDLDNIIGLIYVKDLLCLVGCNSSEDFKTADFIRSVLFVPESTKCRALFAEFKKSKAHMAVVVDEYGGTAGIVSMEDILESVSYTHLDVYKRQGIPFGNALHRKQRFHFEDSFLRTELPYTAIKMMMPLMICCQ